MGGGFLCEVLLVDVCTVRSTYLVCTPHDEAHVGPSLVLDGERVVLTLAPAWVHAYLVPAVT